MSLGNSLVKKDDTFSGFLTSETYKKKINEMMGGKEGANFITSVISAVSVNPGLQECEHSTILSAALIGQSLKLSCAPILGQFFIVPFKERNKNKDVVRVVATFQLGYKGYLQLAIRSGYYRKINIFSLKEGEFVHYDPFTEDLETKMIEDDEVRENTPSIGYYAMFEYHNGFRKTMYWTKKKMEVHAKKYSQAYAYDLKSKTEYSFWSKDFDAMGLKTMLRQLISKWGIMSIDMQKAFEEDKEPVIESSLDYVDTPKETKTKKEAKKSTFKNQEDFTQDDNENKPEQTGEELLFGDGDKENKQ